MKTAKLILVDEDRPVEAPDLDTQPTLALPGEYQIQQPDFIAEVLGIMFPCIMSTETVFQRKQASALLIDLCLISTSTHVPATFRSISLGMYTKESMYNYFLRENVAIRPMLPPERAKVPFGEK
jgi:hypothetical protein